MNYNARSFGGSHKTLTTEDIMAQIKALKQQPASVGFGTNYFATRNAAEADMPLPGKPVDAAGATTLNINPHASEADTGAIPLKNKERIKNFKAVAPVAHPTTASSGDDDITLENKPLAPAASEPMNKAAAAELRSSNDEQDIKDTCGVDDDAEPASDSAADCESNNLFDPDFYKVSIDFFDNGEVRNKTRYTAKLSIQIHEDADPSRNDRLFANFYSRSRDFKAFIERQECWDDWYDNVWDIFNDKCREDLDFRIKPLIAILKERTCENGKASFEPLRHTACMLSQVQGQPPVLAVMYQLWGEEIDLDAEFQAKDAHAPKHKGYYVDPKRVHLEKTKQATGMKIKTRNDFGK